jgi:Rad3-related DNA helicase/REP element-mobilizing transposase RayT
LSDLIDDILGPSGAVARRLGDAYEPRPQQIEMARAVRDAFIDEKHLLVEAGTGVGKSFAYLLPAIELATQQEKRVVISTHTISLQEQLIDKDIPLLQSLYPDEFTAVLVKGRGNYLCNRRLDASLRDRQLLFDNNDQIRSLQAVGEWAKETTDGSLATLPVLPEPGVWDEVRAEHGNCLGKRCSFFEKCFWQAAKRRMNGGNILVVNHALFFSDLALRSAGVNYLPKYDAVIFDEAHTIEDVAGQHFAIKLSEYGVRYQLRQLYDLRKEKGLLAVHGTGQLGHAAKAAVADAADSAGAFFDDLSVWQATVGRGNGRVNQPDIVQTDLGQRLHDLAKLVRAVLKDVKAPEAVAELSSKADRLNVTAQTVDVLVKQTMPDAVYWIDSGTRSPSNARHRPSRPRVTISAAPIDVSAGLKGQLFDRVKRVVMTSATLCTGQMKGSQSSRGTGCQPVLRPANALKVRRGAYLPHWTQVGAIYAVNFRLAGSLPAHAVKSDESAERSFDDELDRGCGECWLNEPAVAELVQSELQHFDGDRYRLLAWAVMPNHVHAVIQPIAGHELTEIVHSWKSYTASKANQLLRRSGPFWQAEYYDHLIRDRDDLLAQINYAIENPANAGLEDWKWFGQNDHAIDETITGKTEDDGLVARATTGEKENSPPLPTPFAYIARRLGLDGSARTLQLGSPFDYPKQATLYIEAGLPDPSDQRKFTAAAISKMEHYLRLTHGGAFVLFTSFAMLRECAEQLRSTLNHLGLPVLVQGVDGTPRQLLQRFRELEDAVLFGTSSFWQGIDVQGSKLRNVIIAKLPFAVPDEPLIEAKLEDVTRKGGNAFMDLSLPEAIIRFKQGFGRLIRSKTDKGIVVVLDTRVKTKRYGRAFLEALPDVRVVEVRE